MHRTRTHLAILALLLFAYPAAAQERATIPPPEDLLRDAATLRGQLDLLKPYEVSLLARDLEARLRRIEDTLSQQAGRSAFYPPTPDIRTIDDARAYLGKLGDRVASLEARLAGSAPGRIAGAIPTPVPLATGNIRLENFYNAPATFTVNGVAYTLEPNEVRTLRDVAAGPYTYEVDVLGYGYRGGRTRTLPPGATDRIFTYPPR